MDNLKSEGKCYYCSKTYSHSGIGRHLSTHLKAIAKEKLTNQKSYHIKVIGGGGLYFLHLLINENTIFGHLDSFLRQIWLDCCGHLSDFSIKGMRRNTIEWSTLIGTVLKKGMKLEYNYDYGSTTSLEIKVINEYAINDKNDILLLTRNEPLKILCDICKKEPAQVMCVLWHVDDCMFCESCREIHAEVCDDFEDYSEGDIVNSPRMGVCGYTGGMIDVERDGVWKK